MRKIRIMTDSCADLPVSYQTKHNIAVINFSIYLNGQEIGVDASWSNISSSSLYGSLRQGVRVWTLPATIHEIRTKMREVLEEGDDIIFIGTSEKQSTTVSKARRVVKSLQKDFPDAKIAVVDSLNASIGITLCVKHAVKCLEKGMEFDDIVASVEGMRNNVIQFATVETLTYLSKANKINARSAALGNLLKIKPILISDALGNQTAMGRVRGREKSIDEIVRLFLENVIDPEEQTIYIIHGDDIASANIVKSKLLASGVAFKKIETTCVGAVVGVTTGPGMVGIFGLGKEVTFKAEE